MVLICMAGVAKDRWNTEGAVQDRLSGEAGSREFTRRDTELTVVVRFLI